MKGADNEVARLKTEPGENEYVGGKSIYVILGPHWTTLTAYLDRLYSIHILR
jgi:hypothetical protein